MLDIHRIEFLLLIAAVVSLIMRRLGVPYTVGLVLAGIGLAFVPAAPDIHLTKDLIFSAFLPPLIFEAAIQMHWRELTRDLPVTMLLATLGVVVSAGLTAAGIHWLLGWDWAIASIAGIVLSSTDPVSVIATFKEARVGGRLRMLVESESLFNDGTAAVLFTVALAVSQGGGVTAGGAIWQFIATMVGGLLCGLVVGGGILLLAGRTEDPVVEITFTTVAAYASFLVAEHFHFSGVLATLAAGILVGNVGSLGSISDKGREAVLIFWEYAAFVANSLVFLLIGLRLAHEHLVNHLYATFVVILLITLGRAVAVYGGSFLFVGSRLRVTRSHQHILFWGGLRGALALALVLGLPWNTPLRDSVITIAFGVVAFSIVVQGLTFKPLLKHLGELGSVGETNDNEGEAGASGPLAGS